MRVVHTQTGYSLIETLVAVSILMLAIVAPMTIAIKSIQSSQYALEQNTATFLAQEALSVVEAVRNANALEHRRGSGGVSSWEWMADGTGVFDDCYTADGCNFDVSDLEGLINTGTGIVRCNTDADCDMYLDTTLEPSAFTLTNTAGSEETGFVRRVYIEEITEGVELQGVLVRAEVKWDSHFLGSERGVVMVTSLYDRYADDLVDRP